MRFIWRDRTDMVLDYRHLISGDDDAVREDIWCPLFAWRMHRNAIVKAIIETCL